MLVLGRRKRRERREGGRRGKQRERML